MDDLTKVVAQAIAEREKQINARRSSRDQGPIRPVDAAKAALKAIDDHPLWSIRRNY